ncbi:DUF2171 domain-containing protein [Sphingomonas sp. ac-8]|uniref:DUF2171 domain-containing protein n=1 Tax=Sphingomonas sp. ac-8 TaxID=3242977 RepID=UPI003A7F8604
MVETSQIRPHMEVLGSDGAHVGTVDHIEGDRIKLARRDSPDGDHHYVPLSAVARVDAHVHLDRTAAALGLVGVATATAATTGDATAASPLPPVKNRAVEGSAPRRNFYLPWIVGLVGLVLLLLLLTKACSPDRTEPVASDTAMTAPYAAEPAAPATGTAALPVEQVTLPGGRTISAEPNSLNYALQAYLASNAPAPRTFTFDKLNFDIGSAAIRAQDQANVDALAEILNAYPEARAQVVGYTDTTGTGRGNAELGQQRGEAVAQALIAKGVDRSRIAAASGGENAPVDTNATAQGRFENRRTELIVIAK